MNLARVESATRFNVVGASHSELVDHGRCCELARHWLIDMHRSHSFNRSGRLGLRAPLWLRHKFKWGPVQWPLSWCEAVRKKEIDCGVYAAFAREIFKDGDHDVYPAQIILAQPQSYIDHWNVKWANISKSMEWIGQDRVYHEVCAVVRKGDDKVRIFDPTEGVWVEPSMTGGINGIIGVNVLSNTTLLWGEMTEGQGRWVLA